MLILQEELVTRLNKERAEQLKTLSAQLILFESRLCRKQKNISALLTQRETVILRQQRAIQLLQQRLSDAGLDTIHLDLPQFDSPTGETNLDSLNDSDSAVIMEDNVNSDQDVMSMLPRFRSGIDAVTVVRSVSDAIEPGNKYSVLRHSEGFLRRPEILETVYSVEEDGEDITPQTTPSGTKTDTHCESVTSSEESAAGCSGSWESGGRLQGLYGSFERLNETPQRHRHSEEPQQNQVTTYNRVMSNHRSVTKPKDVKYKRINKAKSKSLEELRGRLRNWVDKGNKLALSFDQSYA